jgi:hypothetical protein
MDLTNIRDYVGTGRIWVTVYISARDSISPSVYNSAHDFVQCTLRDSVGEHVIQWRIFCWRTRHTVEDAV